LVDRAIYLWRGRKWCHMISDGCLEELHVFAERLGMRREWFQDHPKMPHYDITAEQRLIALQLGAIAAEGAQLLAWVAVPGDCRADWRRQMRERYPHPLSGDGRRRCIADA
jgi:hypothetical protein